MQRFLQKKSAGAWPQAADAARRYAAAAPGRSAFGAEKFGKQRGALVLQHAAPGAHAVQQAAVGQVEQGAAAAGARIERAEYELLKAQVDRRPGAHGARFERDVQRAAAQPPAAPPGRRLHGQQLRMRRAVR